MSSIEAEYIHATEQSLLMLEFLCQISSTNRSTITRQKLLCIRMLNVCANLVAERWDCDILGQDSRTLRLLCTEGGHKQAVQQWIHGIRGSHR